MTISHRSRAALDAAQRNWDNAEPPEDPDQEREQDEEDARLRFALMRREQDACS